MLLGLGCAMSERSRTSGQDSRQVGGFCTAPAWLPAGRRSVPPGARQKAAGTRANAERRAPLAGPAPAPGVALQRRPTGPPASATRTDLGLATNVH